MKRLSIIAVVLLATLVPLACQKTYTVSPLSVPAVVGTPTPVCTGPCTVGYCAGGIYWGSGYTWNYDNNSVSQYGAELALAVNCAPETTDGVTLTGPGVALPLTYSGPATILGTVCAQYQSVTATGGLSTGVSYTLTSVTSIGTATASLPLPISPSVSIGSPVTITWNGFENGCFYLLLDLGAGVSVVETGCGTYAVSPYYMTDICASPCENGAEFTNGTINIIGGSGNYQISNGTLQPGL